MTTPSRAAGLLPALGLFLTAPLVAEYLLGDLPITMLSALLLLAPLYGGGALLVRETTRRLGRGVPTMLLLGLAYGVVEEGVVTQSLFDPGYAGLRLLDVGYVPALGIGGPWTVFVLTLHAVWSTTVPILLVEALVPARRTAPWLGPAGTAVAALLFLAGAVGTGVMQRHQFAYAASTAQLAGSVLAAAVLIALAVRLPRLATGLPGWVPAPWLLGGLALAVGSAFRLSAMGSDWLGTLLTLAGDAVVAALLVTWSRRAAWTPLHTLAVAGGTVAVYAWYAFTQPTLLPSSPAVDLTGDVVFALLAAVLVGAGVVRGGTGARTRVGARL